jgi:SagB-type dehydrogenase family enzyme
MANAGNGHGEIKQGEDMGTAAQYHAHTSYRRGRMSGHSMDWAAQPRVFKRYPGIEPIPLPRRADLPRALLSSVLRGGGRPASPGRLGIEELSRILVLSYSLTASARHGGGEFYFRNAASAGALYPTEIYVASAGIEGLEDGLYHFSIADHGLSRLRREEAERAGVPALTFYLTAVFFRSAWKYRDRAYRYHLLDTGHVVENLTLALKALGLPFSLSYDFDDTALNERLGVDEEREAALAVCRVPGTPADTHTGRRVSGGLPESRRSASRVSSREVTYPAILDIHRSGARVAPSDDAPPTMTGEMGMTPAAWAKIDPPVQWPEVLDCAEAVLRRRSSRNYIPEPVAGDSLRALLEGLCAEDPETSILSPRPEQTLGIGMLVGHAGGAQPGVYLVDPSTRSWGLTASGTFTERMAHICLDQAWLRHASLHVLFMANLATLDRYWGARGYRYAMVNAGRLGQRLYVQATAMGLGCCGIGALYDDEAAELLGLDPTSRLLYLVAVGVVKARVKRDLGN